MNKVGCDYCGHITDTFAVKAGTTCHKCHKGIMCAYGTRGYPKYP